MARAGAKAVWISADWRSSSPATASINASEGETSSTCASTSCSAWLSRSAATVAGSALSSAMVINSDGPAGRSMPGPPGSDETNALAAATQALPGPQIRSQRGISPAPNAKAAIACAPPTVQISSMPAISAASATARSSPPSGRGGVTTVSRSTPATRAGMASISRVENNGALPPGTYSPALDSGRHCLATLRPG